MFSSTESSVTSDQSILSKKKALDIFFHNQKLLQAASRRIERLRDQELKCEMEVMQIFVDDLFMIKFGISMVEYNQAFVLHNMNVLSQVEDELDHTNKCFEEIVERMSGCLN